MPHYYFDVIGHNGTASDNVGNDLAGPEAAKERAISLLPMLVPALVHDGEIGTIIVVVRDDRREIILRASLRLQLEYHLDKEASS